MFFFFFYKNLKNKFEKRKKGQTSQPTFYILQPHVSSLKCKPNSYLGLLPHPLYLPTPPTCKSDPATISPPSIFLSSHPYQSQPRQSSFENFLPWWRIPVNAFNELFATHTIWWWWCFRCVTVMEVEVICCCDDIGRVDGG